MIIDKLNKSDFIYFRDEPNNKGVLGITDNRIVEIPNFIDEETAKSMISYVESKGENWGDIAFYGSLGMGLAESDPGLLENGLTLTFFSDLREKFKEAVELVFERKVRPNTSHAQKWDVGGFAAPHSDNSDFEGKPNAFEINKYVGILYLNDNYDGGELFFVEAKEFGDIRVDSNGSKSPEWNDPYLSFKPNKLSYYVFPGGIENVHGVSEILSGTRYTMVSFWDYEEIEYDQETLDRWEEEEKQVRIAQAIQKEEWLKGNKYA
jgi:hypothetical protein